MVKSTVATFTGLWLILGAPSGIAQPAENPRGGLPESLMNPETVRQRLNAQKQRQLETIKGSSVFYDFRFTDVHATSNLQFEHRVVDDAGKYYKPVHYDHGNGVALADVDSDGLVDIYFTTQLGSNQLWRNVGNMKFENITERAGVALADKISVAASFADVDNDGLPDLCVTTVRQGNHLFRNLGGGRFQDITKSSGLDYRGHSSGAVFFDFDTDGLLDLFVCNVGVYTTDEKGRGGYFVGLRDGFSGHLFPDRTEASILYRNEGGGKFRDVSHEMNLIDKSWSGDAIVMDLNRDRFPDLYVVNMQGDDHYYENQGGKRFVEKAAEYFPKTPWGAMGIACFDVNGDGLMDLYVTDMHSDMTEAATRTSKVDMRPSFEKQKSEQWCSIQYSDAYLQGASNNIFGNALYMNLGNGRFAEVSDRMNVENFWPWGVTVGDLNADGYDDLFVTAGMGFGFRYGINSVFLNDGGKKFFDAEFALGVEPRDQGRTQKVAFVLDCSGVDKGHPYCSGRTGQIPFIEALSSRSSAACDFDNDGDLDIVTLDMNDRPQLLMSNLIDRRSIRYLKLKLIGTESNRDGLGATVRVHAGDRILVQYHAGKSGYFGQSATPLYFGLDGEAPLKVEIEWPSGRNQTVEPVPSSRSMVTIRESSD